MKDEIKEIFNKYGKSHYEDDYSLEFETYIVDLKELKILFDYITNLQEKIDRLNNIIKDIKDYVNFLVIINQTINGKFSETQWGQDILGLIGDDNE